VTPSTSCVSRNTPDVTRCHAKSRYAVSTAANARPYRRYRLCRSFKSDSYPFTGSSSASLDALCADCWSPLTVAKSSAPYSAAHNIPATQENSSPIRHNLPQASSVWSLIYSCSFVSASLSPRPALCAFQFTFNFISFRPTLCSFRPVSCSSFQSASRLLSSVLSFRSASSLHSFWSAMRSVWSALCPFQSGVS
jgi:hypothetical protein